MAPEGSQSHNEARNSQPANLNAIDQTSREEQSSEEQIEERRKIRRLQLMMDMVMSVIGQDPNLTIDEAAEMVADSRRAALAMFPDKEARLQHPLQAPPAAPHARAISNPVA